VRNGDRAFVEANSQGIPVAGFLSEDERVNDADRHGIPVFDAAPHLIEEALLIAQVIDQEDGAKEGSFNGDSIAQSLL
jgi:hypothetical protein